MNKNVNMMTIDIAIDRYYASVGIDRYDSSRKNQTSQARMALSNTLSMSGMSNDDISKIIGRHRTSVYHHLKHHNGEVKHWQGYNSKFEKCKMLVGGVFESAETESKLTLLELNKANLKDEIKSIEAKMKSLKLIK
tara:strand:- start:1618 stop:2025 length:408 start_codon:yes stop_codon:yes gene_type:complete